MEVISVKRGRMVLELTPREKTALIIRGLKLELEEMGCKAKLVTMEEAEAMGLKKKKGAKIIELSDEECRLMVEKAVTTCLKRRIEEEKAKRAKKKK